MASKRDNATGEPSSADEDVGLVRAVLPAFELNSSSAQGVAVCIETILPAMDSVLMEAERVLALEPDIRRSLEGSREQGSAVGTPVVRGGDAEARAASSTLTVDVCFLIDCTNSMEHILHAVRDKVVEVALGISQTLAQASQTVKVRMAFVGFRDYAREPLAPGLKWQDVGYERPARGSLITNHALTAAMRYRQDFTVADLLAMRLDPAHLTHESFVRVMNKYYQPVKFDYPEACMSVCDFTEDAEEIRRCVADQEADREPQDIPEDLCGGLKQVLQLSWDTSSRKAVFVFTDAPCHGVQVASVYIIYWNSYAVAMCNAMLGSVSVRHCYA